MRIEKRGRTGRRRTPPRSRSTPLDRSKRAASLSLRLSRVKHHKPSHECGVFAVFGHPNAAVLTYYGLFALQHRGQESAGIVTASGVNTPFVRHVGMGLVSQVFSPADLERLKGTRAI